MICARFRDTCGNRADTDFRAEFDADARLGIAILEVVDELRDVFDRVNVVVRRRADEADARRGMADTRDEVVHFVPG